MTDEKKQAIIETFKPTSCEEVPLSLEDIFIECTKVETDPLGIGEAI